MTSSFGWLDNDDEQRRRMLEVVDLFREQGTIDELGIGSIRDTLSNAMFPGISVLHTRLRYVLFVPWLMQNAAAKQNPSAMTTEFKHLEYRLIESLLAGGESEGVMGNTARSTLKRLPSSAYWSTLGAWGLVNASSADAYFRRYADLTKLRNRTADADDPSAHAAFPGDGIDASFPPAPGGLLSAATFALTDDEEGFLSDHISVHAEGTLLAWLVAHMPKNLDSEAGPAQFPWELSNVTELPPDLANLVAHSKSFSSTIQGASYVYNLALARKANRDDAVSTHEAGLAAWQDEGGREAAASWDRANWWDTALAQNPRIASRTRAFVDSWADLAASGRNLLDSHEASTLVETRERQIKGSRARFVNQSALDKWSGSSGLGRLAFRWGNVRSHLRDLQLARETA